MGTQTEWRGIFLVACAGGQTVDIPAHTCTRSGSRRWSTSSRGCQQWSPPAPHRWWLSRDISQSSPGCSRQTYVYRWGPAQTTGQTCCTGNTWRGRTRQRGSPGSRCTSAQSPGGSHPRPRDRCGPRAGPGAVRSSTLNSTVQYTKQYSTVH